MPRSLPPELVSVSERIGIFMNYWGFSKIDGKIWTHIFLAPKPLSAEDLRRRLGVSKALISSALKELLAYRVIEAAGTARYGTTLYRSNENLQEVVESVLRIREQCLLADVTAAAGTLSRQCHREGFSSHVSHTKVKELEEMCVSAQKVFEGLVLTSSFLSQISNFQKKNPGDHL